MSYGLCLCQAYASIKALFIYLKIFLYFRSSDESHVTFDVDSFTKALDRILGETASLFHLSEYLMVIWLPWVF